MTPTGASAAPTIDIEDLGLDRGAHILIKRALADVPVGGRVGIRGQAPELSAHLLAWCRAQGHEVLFPDDPGGPVAWIVRGGAQTGRWRGAERAGAARFTQPGAVAEHPEPSWGLAARGATIEAGSPAFHFALADKDEVWTDDAARLYSQAAAAQWDPDGAIDWEAPVDLPDDVEDAVVQVMTYLIENENAALVVPARFLGQVHPHFKEVAQVLAIQCADEARHIEVFTRRALLRGREPGLSAASGQVSLKTLVDEPDFAIASFLLSVLGEGSFLNLLNFLQHHAPDPITRQVAKLAAQDEARHVAFGMAHLQRHLLHDPRLAERLAAAIERRHDALAQTAGLNEEVFDALVVLAAGSWDPAAIAAGFDKVQQLKRDMDAGRRARLGKLGFAGDQAESLSALHTRNFM